MTDIVGLYLEPPENAIAEVRVNLVEVWFGTIERQAIHRGTFRNVRELTANSGTSSTGGTHERSRSSGQEPPSRYSRKPTVEKLHEHRTSSDSLMADAL